MGESSRSLQWTREMVPADQAERSDRSVRVQLSVQGNSPNLGVDQTNSPAEPNFLIVERTEKPSTRSIEILKSVTEEMSEWRRASELIPAASNAGQESDLVAKTDESATGASSRIPATIDETQIDSAMTDKIRQPVMATKQSSAGVSEEERVSNTRPSSPNLQPTTRLSPAKVCHELVVTSVKSNQTQSARWPDPNIRVSAKQAVPGQGLTFDDLAKLQDHGPKWYDPTTIVTSKK